MLQWPTWTDRVPVVVWKHIRNQLKKGGDFMVAGKEALLVEAEVQTGHQQGRDGEEEFEESTVKETSDRCRFWGFESGKE